MKKECIGQGGHFSKWHAKIPKKFGGVEFTLY